MKSLGKTVVGLVSLFVGALFSGWGLSVLWGWFVVPLFHAPILTIAPAVGLIMTIRYVTGYTDGDDTKYDSATAQVVYGAAKSLLLAVFTVILGWIVLQFV